MKAQQLNSSTAQLKRCLSSIFITLSVFLLPFAANSAVNTSKVYHGITFKNDSINNINLYYPNNDFTTGFSPNLGFSKKVPASFTITSSLASERTDKYYYLATIERNSTPVTSCVVLLRFYEKYILTSLNIYRLSSITYDSNFFMNTANCRVNHISTNIGTPQPDGADNYTTNSSIELAIDVLN